MSVNFNVYEGSSNVRSSSFSGELSDLSVVRWISFKLLHEFVKIYMWILKLVEAPALN